MTDPRHLAQGVLEGRVAAAARACRWVDERIPGHEALSSALYSRAQAAWLVGVTGSPGVGKSTLVSQLVRHHRQAGAKVAVVAVDPTSPFSGGAILGDRIRMQDHFEDPGVFIRSVATRGALGGLSHTTADVARVLGAWGAGVVLIETVGVGQDELDVMNLAHSTLVVVAPGAGDDVQAAKAGLMECADVFAVNKSDRPGAERVAAELRAMLALGGVTATAFAGRSHSARSAKGAAAPDARRPPDDEAAWEVVVTPCSAATGEGVGEVAAQLLRHRRWLQGSPAGRERVAQRHRAELETRIRSALTEAVLARHAAQISDFVEQVLREGRDPYSASSELVGRLLDPGATCPEASSDPARGSRGP